MRNVLALLCCVTVSACGGGGGGAGSPPPPPSLPPGPPQLTMPGPATLNYSGSTSAWHFDEAQAGVITDFSTKWIQSLRVQTADVGTDQVPRDPGGAVNATLSGPQGGTLRLTGSLPPGAGTGWVQVEYVDYVNQGATVNGRTVQEILPASSGYQRRTRFSGYDLFVTSISSGTTVSNFNLYVDENAGTGAQRITGDFLISIGTRQQRIESASIESSPSASNLWSFNVRARLFDSVAGYVDVSTPAPMLFGDSDGSTPVAGGPLLIRGAGQAAFRLEPLNAANVSLAADFTGQDLFVRSLRLSSAKPYSSQVNASGTGLPAAVLGSRRSVAANDTVPRLDGRYSTHADGKFLTYSWRTLLAPSGASVVISNPTLPRPASTFEVPGMYRFELTVSDGTHVSRDRVDLAIDPQGYFLLPDEIAALAPPDQHMNLGESIDLDTSAWAFATPTHLDYDVLAFSNSGQPVPLSMPGRVAHLTPAEPGLYRVLVRIVDQGPTFHESKDVAWLYVDREPLFDLPWLQRPDAGGEVEALLAADLSGDGHPELIAINRPAVGPVSPVSNELAIYRGRPGPDFIGPRVVIPSVGGREVAVGDLNGDGRPDLVTVRPTGIAVNLQLPDGTFADAVGYGSNSACQPPNPNALYGLSVADVNGDGRLDIVRERACGDGIEAYLQQPDHSFSATYLLSGAGIPRALADFTGDGRVDLIVNAPNQFFALYRSLAGGGFAPAEVLDTGAFNPSSRYPAVCQGDINLDGRADFVAGAETRTAVMLQLPSGGLAAPASFSPPTATQPMAPGECLVFDASGDGRPDVLVQPTQGDPYLLLQGQSGNFTVQSLASRMNGASFNATHALNAVDLDGDGARDLVYVSPDAIVLQLHID